VTERSQTVSDEAAARPCVLVVDDDEGSLRALERLLIDDGFSTVTATDGDAAIVAARSARPDVVLTDLRMPGMHGIELCRRLHEIDDALPVVVMTGRADMDAVIESLRGGAEDFLLKPLDYDTVLWRVERALARRNTRLEHDTLRRDLNERLLLSSLREQEHAEREHDRRAQLSALLANLQEGVVVADRGGQVQTVNAAARAILGVGDEDLRTVDAGAALELRAPGGRRLEPDEHPLPRALRGEQFVDYEVIAARPDGEPRWLMTTGTSVRDERGDVSLAIVVFRDVTDLRALERQREEYLGLISHDLHNPLGTIAMGIAMLKASLVNGRPAPEDLGIAERVERNVTRMRTMLADLSGVTSIEARGVDVHGGAPCDLRKVLTDAVDSMDDLRGRRITVEPPSASPLLASADASQIERVVANLLSNALKYSADDAPVTARVTRHGSEIALVVVDRGIGIAPQSVERLFDRYFRTTPAKARASGLGLGLYIARQIVEAQGGRIEVASELGVGSSFTLVLPAFAAGPASNPLS
jgi:PAS domain S-box-containing protein